MNTYRAFFGLQQDPFANDLSLKQIMKTPELSAVKNRFNYALSIGGVAVVTGDIGSGKSTAVRYAQCQLHPSEYISLHVIATSGAIMELSNIIRLGHTQNHQLQGAHDVNDPK